MPRQAIRDPDHWLLVVAFLLLFLCGIQLLIFPFGRSQAAYALLGRAIVAGYAPVKDAWTAQSPGIGLLHAAIQVTLGRSMMAFRAIETIAVVGVVLAATRITKRWVGLERAGLIGGAVFALTYIQLEIDQTGQPEFFGGVLLLHAISLLSRDPSPRNSKITATLLGLLLGLTVLLVPCLVVAIIPFAWLLIHREKSQSLRPSAPWLVGGCIFVGFAAPLACFATWLAATGTGTIFVRDWLNPVARLWLSNSVIDWASQIFDVAYNLTLRQSALLTAGLLATFTLGTIHEHERAGRRLLLLITVAAAVGLAVERNDSPGTLAAAYPMISTLAGIGIYKAWRRIMTQGVVGSVAFATTAILLFQMCSPVNYPPGRFLQRSKVRLLFLSGLAPYHSREMLESELYNSKDYSLTASRRLASDLRERSLSNRDVWIDSDDPQLAWLLEDVPKWRFLRPVPAAIAHGAPNLKRRADDEAALTKPQVIVLADQSTDGRRAIALPQALRVEYALLESQDNWNVMQRVPAKPRPLDDSEFCDPNSN